MAPALGQPRIWEMQELGWKDERWMMSRTASYDKPELAPSEQRILISADSRATHRSEKTSGHSYLS